MPNVLVLTNSDGSSVQFNLHRSATGKRTLVGPAHSDISTESVDLISKDPTPKGDKYGFRRSEVNFRKGVTTPLKSNTETIENISVSMRISVPVGADPDVVAEALARAASALETSEVSGLVATGAL